MLASALAPSLAPSPAAETRSRTVGGSRSRHLSGAIERGVGFLAGDQQSNGEFVTYLANEPTLMSGVRDSCNFVTGLFLLATAHLDDPRLHAMRTRARVVLLDEMENPGLWRYWTRSSGKPIPCDLDDTALISLALGAETPVDNHPSVLRNRTVEGHFATWIQPDTAVAAANDVDSVVNANVLAYLGDRPETRASADALVTVVRTDRESESYWYYLDDLALHHAMARAMHHGVRGLDTVRDRIEAKVVARLRPDQPLDPLATALALGALGYLGHRGPAIAAGVERLLDSQRAEGSWPRVAYYTGPEPPAPHAAWFGSEALTTCLCLEALGLMDPLYASREKTRPSR